MSFGDRTKGQINSALAKWNPLDVPDFIAEVEYKSYVHDILSIGCKPDALVVYLKNMLEESLGLGLDEDNVRQHREIQELANEISAIMFDQP